MRALAALVAIVCAAGCVRGPRSAEEAMAELRQAVERGDASAVYPLLDQQTRWSIDSTRKYQRECIRLIDRSYPEEVRGRERRRFIDAGGSPEFLAGYDERYHFLAEQLRPRLGTPAKDEFVRDRFGRWGYAGLRAQWDDAKQRAYHDLQTVRDSARAYARARDDESG